MTIRVYVLHMNQDDPKKCTARKMARFGMAKMKKRPEAVPSGSIVLSPYSNRILSPADRQTALRRGLTVVDCSWKNAEEVFSRIRGNFRRLPYLVPVNPTNYGHPGQLSSAEAVSAALYIMGEREQAERIMALFKWGPNFFVMNREPLSLYEKSENEKDVEKYEHEFF